MTTVSLLVEMRTRSPRRKRRSPSAPGDFDPDQVPCPDVDLVDVARPSKTRRVTVPGNAGAACRAGVGQHEQLGAQDEQAAAAHRATSRCRQRARGGRPPSRRPRRDRGPRRRAPAGSWPGRAPPPPRGSPDAGRRRPARRSAAPARRASTARRSDSASASAASRVTWMVVTARSRCSRASSSRSVLRGSGSRWASGSSSSRMRGSTASARASASRRRSVSVIAGGNAARSVSSRRVPTTATRWAMSSADIPCCSRPKATCWTAVMCGQSAPSWKT